MSAAAGYGYAADASTLHHVHFSNLNCKPKVKEERTGQGIHPPRNLLAPSAGFWAGVMFGTAVGCLSTALLSVSIRAGASWITLSVGGDISLGVIAKKEMVDDESMIDCGQPGSHSLCGCATFEMARL